VKRKLADLGLSLGMDLDAAPQQAAATMLDDEVEEAHTSGAPETSTSE